MKLAIAAFALLLAAAPAHAALTDNFEFSDAGATLLVRVAYGDIPTTTANEAGGQWNFVHYQTGVDSVYKLPAGATYDGVDCTCEFTVNTAGQTYTVHHNGTGAKSAFRYHMAGATAVTFTVDALASGPAQVVAYLIGGKDSGFDLHGKVAVAEPLAVTDNNGLYIHDARVNMGESAWFVIEPVQPAATPASGMNWFYVAAAGLGGMILWAFLVNKGLVQSRSRKQVAQVAAHVEVAKKEPKAVLEGKKRALLAALKEVELAKQANEMDATVYDAVKADFKKEAVTVMRAIEESGE